MRVLVAQKFERMWREIDEHEDALWAQHASRLGERRRRPIGVMQHLVDHDSIEGFVRQGPVDTCRRAERIPFSRPDPFEIDPRYQRASLANH